MATLSQTISGLGYIPGASSFDKQKALYEKLGSPKGGYTGSTAQNLYLLSQLNQKGQGDLQALFNPIQPSTPAPALSPVAQEANAISSKVPMSADFSKVLPFGNFFDEALAREGASAQTRKYYDPILQEQIDNFRNAISQRNLLRSGIRTRGENDVLTNVSDLSTQMRDQLFNQRRGEQQDAYLGEQQRYENDPTGYQAPTINSPSTPNTFAMPVSGNRGQARSFVPYTATPQVTPAEQANQPIIKGGKYGLGYATNSPNKYGTSFSQWYKQKFGSNL